MRDTGDQGRRIRNRPEGVDCETSDGSARTTFVGLSDMPAAKRRVAFVSPQIPHSNFGPGFSLSDHFKPQLRRIALTWECQEQKPPRGQCLRQASPQREIESY